MRTRLGAAVLGVLAGVLLGAAAGLSFLAGNESDSHRLVAVAGYGVGIAALVLVGHGLAGPRAPAWLRVIVSVGLALLAVSVWELVSEEVERRVDGWHGPATTHLLAALLLVLVGTLQARRVRAEDRGYHPTHR